MIRRDVIILFASAAVAILYPWVARAQRRTIPVIGFLSGTSPEALTERLRAFRQGLKEIGFIEGENVAIEYRWAENRMDHLPELAVELVRRRVAVIATAGGNVTPLVAKRATGTIPIVFGVSDDPVKLGLVVSLARPGGNATGVNFFIAELVHKRLALLHELLPGASRITVLVNPANAVNAESVERDTQTGARALGLQVEIVRASTIDELQTTFETLARERPDALFVGNDPFFYARRVQLATLAARHGLPASFAERDFVTTGGLMSYGANVNDSFRQIGVYTGRLLKGEKPSDLPVVQPTRFELVINLSTAKALGVNIPPMLLARADEAIE